MRGGRSLVAVSVVALAALALGNCGEADDDAPPPSGERGGQSGAPPIDAVPVSRALRVIFTDVTCGVTADRCVRNVVVEPSKPAGDEVSPVTRQRRNLEAAGWNQVKVCGSDVLQFEDADRRYEVFLFQASVFRRREVAGDRRSRIAIALENAAPRALVLQVAEAARSAPC